MTPRLPVVVAIVNSKGGVGKTTTSINLGAAIASSGRRVLLVDLDSQASASLWCGVKRGRLRPSSATCLLHGCPIDRAIRETSTPNLHLVTGSVELANVDVESAEMRGGELALKHLLHGVRRAYDLVLLDCPPSLSLVGVNALVAADALIIPVTPQFLAAEGLLSLLATVDTVRARLRVRARLLGILMSMVHQRSRSAGELRERLRAQFRDRVFHTEIPLSPALENAPAAGETIFSFAPRSKAADTFRRLAGEVLERLRSLRSPRG